MTVDELIFKLVRETKGVAWQMPVCISQDDNSEKQVESVYTDEREGGPVVVVSAS